MYNYKNMKTTGFSKSDRNNETWSGMAIGVAGFAVTAYISYYFYKKRQKAKTNNQEQVLNTQRNNAVKINNAKTVNDIERQNNEADCTIRVERAKTENKIKVMTAESKILMNQKKELIELKKQLQLNQKPIVKMKLSEWIDEFHAEYQMPNTSSIPVLGQLLKSCSPGMRDAMLFHLCASFGAICFSKVRAEWEDNKQHSPSILTIIEGDSGSGKGMFNTMYECIFEQVIKRDDEKLKRDDSSLFIIPTAGINMSEAEFHDRLAYNKGVHIFAMETEIAKVAESFKKGNGLSFSYIRNAFDNDYQFRNNKGKSCQGRERVYLNCTFTGTPKAIDKLFTEAEVEGGTARRFCFSAIPEIDNEKGNKIKLPSEKVLNEIRNTVDEWQRNYCFISTDKGDLPCKDFLIDLRYIRNKLREWITLQIERANQDQIPERKEMSRAISTIAFHCAIVLHMMAGNSSNNNKCVSNLTLYIANYCMERYLAKFGICVGKVIALENQKKKLTPEEIEDCFSLRGTTGEDGRVIGLGTLAKKFGVTKDEVRNALTRFERNLQRE